MNDLLLDVRGLQTHFFTDDGVVRAVNGVDFTIGRGQTVALVGESGCGKSVTARSLLQIVDPPGRIVSGQILFHPAPEQSVDLAALSPRGKAIRQIRGKDIAMIFQEPMTSLGPVHTIGNQIIEAVRLHLPLSKAEARERAVEALARVGIPRPAQRMEDYPFQLSGGMRQRAMIAMALVCEPKLLIADEPTTALDVTTQANILDLLQELQADTGMSVLFITHDLGVVAELADEVVVLYLGQVAERGTVDEIFHDPKHPYTRALLRSIPMIGMSDKGDLATIRGMIPPPFRRPAGCPFHPRCVEALPGRCDVEVPPELDLGAGRAVRCLLHGPAPRTVSSGAASTTQNPA